MLDIEEDLAGVSPESEFRAATRRETIRELCKEFPLTPAVMRVLEARGVDVTRWGMERVVTEEPVLDDDGAPVLGDDGEPRKTEVVTYNNATFVMRELQIGEMKAAGMGATEVDLEKKQIEASLLRFGRMDVKKKVYELEYILGSGGHILHILLMACSNSLMFPGGQFEDITEAMGAAKRGKFL